MNHFPSVLNYRNAGFWVAADASRCLLWAETKAMTPNTIVFRELQAGRVVVPG